MFRLSHRIGAAILAGALALIPAAGLAIDVGQLRDESVKGNTDTRQSNQMDSYHDAGEPWDGTASFGEAGNSETGIVFHDLLPVAPPLADCAGEGFVKGPDYGTTESLPELIATYCYGHEPVARVAGGPDRTIIIDLCAGEGLAGGKDRPVMMSEAATICFLTARYAGPVGDFEPWGRSAGQVDE